MTGYGINHILVTFGSIRIGGLRVIVLLTEQYALVADLLCNSPLFCADHHDTRECPKKMIRISSRYVHRANVSERMTNIKLGQSLVQRTRLGCSTVF
jgi:hypothetical protein